MKDAERWDLRGPVMTLRAQSAQWDVNHGNWLSPQQLVRVEFNSNGRLHLFEHYGPEGSAFTSAYSYAPSGELTEIEYKTNGVYVGKLVHSYDAAGRLISIESVMGDGSRHDVEIYAYESGRQMTSVRNLDAITPAARGSHQLDGTDLAVRFPGAVSTVTTYDAYGRTTKVLFRDSKDASLGDVTILRDSEGRPVEEAISLPEQLPFSELQGQIEHYSPEERARLLSALTNVFGSSRKPVTRTYRYDLDGKVTERITRMNYLLEERTTFRYDNHANPVERHTRRIKHEFRVDETGELHPSAESSEDEYVRFVYQYDLFHNWTERVEWAQRGLTPEVPRLRERREIAYYA
jgi:hypothetical protein